MRFDMATKTTKTPSERVKEADLEILEATIEALTQAVPVGLSPSKTAASAGRLAKAMLTQPKAIGRRTMHLTGEMLQIAAGTSDIAPTGDRRFGDSSYASNPVYKRLAQSYLAGDSALHSLIDDLDLDEKTRLRAELAVNIVSSTTAPTNHLLGNPAALKEAKRTKGKSLVAGARHAAHDVRHNGGMPSMVDSRPFVPGETIATTPGVVVFSNPVLELIQYKPTTTKVYKRPIMVVPPQINKYYILDLAPGRSLIEHLVGEGQQVFCISWRNAEPSHRDWDLDTYVAAVLEATEATMEISKTKDINLLGVCAGGITATAMLGHLVATNDKRINSASFLVTVLDWETPSTIGTFVSPTLAKTVGRMSKRKGVLSGDDLGKLFAWLRPNDLIWNYWVNNYLMGKNPPEFDVLAWNGDSTNLPAALHRDFLQIALTNGMAKAGAVEVLDHPIDLADVACDTFVVGAETDHITPWRACYGTVNFLGGNAEFVLSSQGHIQALVNPSGNPKGRYRTNADAADGPRLDADEWLDGSAEHAGSWWDYWTEWLSSRSDTSVNAPKTLGSATHPAGIAAPGEYVLA
ncbi:MAG: polyhydroxyalkanoate synthase [Acidimicrobiales bacterium]|jgi:polyhydroxyalkanoate synthase subunit PhaC